MKQKNRFLVFAIACFLPVLAQSSDTSPDAQNDSNFTQSTPELSTDSICSRNPITFLSLFLAEISSDAKVKIRDHADPLLFVVDNCIQAAKEKITNLQEYFMLLNNETFENSSDGISSRLSKELGQAYEYSLPEERKAIIKARITKELDEIALILREGNVSPKRQEAFLQFSNKINDSFSAKQKESLAKLSRYAHYLND